MNRPETGRRRYLRRHSSRNGLSILEFIGCLIAVVGGIWLGAVYAGVDVEKLAYTALEDAELLDSIPEQMRPPCPEGHPCQLNEDELASVLHSELAALRQEITALRKTTSLNSKAAADGEVAFDPTQPVLEDTVSYWHHLRGIASDESALQMGAKAAATEMNADRVFALRGRVSRFAAKAVETAPSDRVDEHLLQFGRQLAQWYLRAGEHYDRGAQLWSDRNAQDSSAQLTQRWETAERQLRNEAELMRNKAASLRAALSRQYRTEFEEFGS